MESALWGFLFALTHFAAFVTGSAMGGLVTFGALQLWKHLLRPVIRQGPPANPLMRKPTAEEQLAAFESSWASPDIFEEGYNGRGPVKRSYDPARTRVPASGSAFQASAAPVRASAGPKSGGPAQAGESPR